MGQNDSWDYLTNFIKDNFDNFEEELEKPPLAVKIKRHPERPNLVIFRYSQYESDFTNPIVRCCRGSVYDIQDKDTVRPYLMPFFKFNNLGEGNADPINWKSTLYIREKLDGSLIKLLKEPDGNDLWTTNRSFDINAEVPELYPSETEENLKPPYTFASLRDYALRGHEDEVKNLPIGWSFMFELISPYNKIVVPYRETKLILLGCRDPERNEHTPEWAVESFKLSFETPKLYQFNTADEIISYCKSLETNEHEGVVVQDENFNRVKIKSEHYVSLFLLKGEDNFSDKRIFQAIKQGSIDDALAAWPEIGEKADEIKTQWINFQNDVKNLCNTGRTYYENCLKDTGELKEAKKRYAQYVMEKHKTFSSFLFEAIKENSNLDPLFEKIEYRELVDFWIPAIMEQAED